MTGNDLATDRRPRANERRAKVIRAAAELFAKNGFHATGIAQIAQESGVLVGQIYRDFANKEDIVAAVVQSNLDDYLADAGLTPAIESGDERAVRCWIARFLACEDIEKPSIFAEILAEAARNDRMAQIFRDVEARLRGELIRALKVVAAPGTGGDRLNTLTEMILTFSAGVMHRRMTNPDGFCPEALAATTACIYREIDPDGACSTPEDCAV